MQVKHRFFIVLTIVFSTLLLTATMCLPTGINTINTENPTEVIITPKPSITPIRYEFVQERGHSFDYSFSDDSGNFLKTGDGAFKLRVYSDNLGADQELRLSLLGEDKHYNVFLYLDLLLIEDPLIHAKIIPWLFPPSLVSIYDLMSMVDIEAMVVRLSSFSVNELQTTYTTSAKVPGQSYYEFDIPIDEYYLYDPLISLGNPEINPLAIPLNALLELVGFDLGVAQQEFIQNIKYGIMNYFTLDVYDTDEGAPVSGGMGGEDYVTLEVRNDDTTPPNYIPPTWDQENPASNWEIKMKIFDEFYGSGVSNETIKLFYSVNKGPYKQADNMLLYEDGFHYGEIPNQLAGSEVSFYVEITDMAGNSRTTEIYSFTASPLELQPVVILLIGIAVVTIGSIAATRIYRNRHQPRVITLPTKKKVDKYYKQVKKEGGSI
ncbi:MAG: hypothetical protein ACFFBP_00905 [Promethearchaeota archaeon]